MPVCELGTCAKGEVGGPGYNQRVGHILSNTNSNEDTNTKTKLKYKDKYKHKAWERQVCRDTNTDLSKFHQTQMSRSLMPTF